MFFWLCAVNLWFLLIVVSCLGPCFVAPFLGFSPPPSSSFVLFCPLFPLYRCLEVNSNVIGKNTAGYFHTLAGGVWMCMEYLKSLVVAPVAPGSGFMARLCQ